MKHFFIILIIIVVIVTGSILIQKYLYNSSGELEILLQKISIQMKDEEYDETYNELKEKWSKTRKKWATITDHNELDDIEKILINMNGFMKSGEENKAIIELEKAKFLISHIPERHNLKLENIF